MRSAEQQPDHPVQGHLQLSVEEAARHLAVSVATVYRYMAKGILRFHKVKSQRLIEQHDLEACKAQRVYDHRGSANRRRIQAKAAAHTLHSLYDSRALTAPARDAFLKRFERQVDPEGRLSANERVRRATQAKEAYFTNLALSSSKSRSRTDRRRD
jgi:excisionase family DNA binding protein